MPEIIIADSSALIALEKIGLSNILCEMYPEVLLPEAVIEEYGIPGFPCFSIRKIQDRLLSLLSVYANLGKGESEVIVLAYQTGIKAIIDDMKAHKAALKLGLTITGTIGVLLKAEKIGLISSAYDKAEELRKNGFYVSDEVLKDILRFKSGN